MLPKFISRYLPLKESHNETDQDIVTIQPLDSDVQIKSKNVNNNCAIVDIELATDQLDPCTDDATAITNKSCVTASLPGLVFFGLVMISLVLGHQYIFDILLYMDSLDLWESTVLFAVMFTMVAFPIMWGYVLLNVACGYVYGFIGGTLMVCGCVSYALLCAHFIIRRFFKGYVERTYVVNDQARALMQVVSGKNGYKIVFLMRLTPIPFGIQNAIFAVSRIATLHYIAASVTSLLITQAVYSYMGSTLRSMAQVFSGQNSVYAWIMLSVQLFVMVALTAFIVKLARAELDKTISGEATHPPVSQTKSTMESVGIQTSKDNKRPRSHSRNKSVNIPPLQLSQRLEII